VRAEESAGGGDICAAGAAGINAASCCTATVNVTSRSAGPGNADSGSTALWWR
jgi:hypothetical protein